MNIASKLIIALAAATTGGLAMASELSSDQQRRERNREEAIANWQLQGGHERMADHRDRTATDRHDGRPTAHGSLQENAKVASQQTSSFTHRQLEKLRDFGERQEARLPGPANPTQESNKAPAAIGK